MKVWVVCVFLALIWCGVGYAQTADDNPMDQLAKQRAEAILMTQGLDAEMAHWATIAIWSAPYSQCGMYASELEMADNPTMDSRRVVDALSSIIRTHACDRATVLAAIHIAQARPPFDPLKVKIVYPPEALDEDRGGSVVTSCHFGKHADGLWYPENCKVISSVGGKMFVDATMEYYAHVAWTTATLPAKLDASGNARLRQTFSTN